MATTIIEPLKNHSIAAMTYADPKPLKVCFSYAAYAKNLIHRLSSSNIPVEIGLSEDEFFAVESSFNFIFPPDLRSIIQEGLPVGPGFPNWRSSSKQQLDILTNLPVLGICKEVSRNEFWPEFWGDKPGDIDRAVNLAKGFLKKAPVLVPIYRRFYIPSTPCMAGNPVFYVHGGEVKLWSFDIAGFFQQIEFRMSGAEEVLRQPTLSNLFTAPAWAASEARRIDFWSDLAAGPDRAAARDDTRGWWSGELGGCLQEVCWRLRDGGWKEEDVREMMMMDGRHYQINRDDDNSNDAACVEWRVKVLSTRLLRAGWSTEDVADSLGFPHCYHNQNLTVDEDSCFDFHHQTTDNDEQKQINNNRTVNLQCIKV